MVKRCFICGAREDVNHHCTNTNCPRSIEMTSSNTPDTTNV